MLRSCCACLLVVGLVACFRYGPELILPAARRDALPGTWELAGSDLPSGVVGLPSYKRFCGLRRGALLALSRDGELIVTVGSVEVVGEWELIGDTLRLDGWPDDPAFAFPSSARWTVLRMTPHRIALRWAGSTVYFRRVAAGIRPRRRY